MWPFQGFNGVSNARVSRMFMEEPAAESETTTEEDMFGKPILLGKGTTIDDCADVLRIVHNSVKHEFENIFSGDRKSVKFEWVITEWSKCSPPCGGNGYQVRIYTALRV